MTKPSAKINVKRKSESAPVGAGLGRSRALRACRKSASFRSAVRKRSSTANASSPSCASEGYTIARDYSGADVVVVNTCGFLDSAKQESLDAIGEAMNANGRVIVTGCFGVEEGAHSRGASGRARGDGSAPIRAGRRGRARRRAASA